MENFRAKDEKEWISGKGREGWRARLTEGGAPIDALEGDECREDEDEREGEGEDNDGMEEGAVGDVARLDADLHRVHEAIAAGDGDAAHARRDSQLHRRRWRTPPCCRRRRRAGTGGSRCGNGRPVERGGGGENGIGMRLWGWEEKDRDEAFRVSDSYFGHLVFLFTPPSLYLVF